MRNIRFLLLFLICLICASCQPIAYNPNTGGNNGVDDPIKPTVNYDVISSQLPYEEASDSLEGLTEDEIKDLSELKNAFDQVGSNYTSKTRVFFNSLAVERVNSIYETNFYCQQTRFYNVNYIYRYTEDLVIDEGFVSYNDNIYKLNLPGNDLNQKFNNPINVDSMKLYKESATIKNHFFTIDKLNSEYVDNTGPTTVDSEKYFGWTRISTNKYKCDRKDVLNDFLQLCVPGFDNGGTYMTFDYVTVEINPDNENLLRLRLYASSTQIGKLISSHTTPEKENWFLLFAEAYISRIDQTEIFAFESLYK